MHHRCLLTVSSKLDSHSKALKYLTNCLFFAAAAAAAALALEAATFDAEGPAPDAEGAFAELPPAELALVPFETFKVRALLLEL